MTTTTQPQSSLCIKQLCIYPIKSLRGCPLPSLTATATGFANDRRFMLQRTKDDKNMAIAHFPEMCLFTTSISPTHDPETIVVTYTKGSVFDRPEETVEDEVLEIPLVPDVDGHESSKRREVNLHSSPTVGYEMDAKYNEWFSRRFGYGVRLVYVGSNRREVLGSVSPNSTLGCNLQNQNGNQSQNQGWFGTVQSSLSSLVSTLSGSNDANTENQSQYTGIDRGLGFADCAPFLIVSTTSHDNAAKRVTDGDFDIFKFRPNIIVEGASEDYEEDFWAELAIVPHSTRTSGKVDGEGNDRNGNGKDDIRFILTSNCARCTSLNVDYDTGKIGTGDAGKILKLLQKDRRVDQGMKYSPVFGRYGFLASRKIGGGKGHVEDDLSVVISVGDEVSVVRRNEGRTRFQWPNMSTDN